MTVAFTREVSDAFDRCEVTWRDRAPIDVALARVQHEAYEAALRALGCEVRRIEASADHPDCVFVEDTAIVLDEAALITRPGAESRRGETRAVADALAALRPLRRAEAPAIVDGGDVLRIGHTIHVGRSSRTDAAGVAWLRECAEPFGYEVREIAVEGCLHLKSAATLVGSGTVLVDPRCVDVRSFDGLGVIETDPREPGAANALLVEGSVIYPASHPHTRARLEADGVRVVALDVSEVQKAEGGVTCCSVLV